LYFPEKTFKFNFDPKNAEFSNQFWQATKNLETKVVDENGNPIEGAIVYTKDRGSEDGGAYIATSDTPVKQNLKY